jgi:hypothetical protein
MVAIACVMMTKVEHKVPSAHAKQELSVNFLVAGTQKGGTVSGQTQLTVHRIESSDPLRALLLSISFSYVRPSWHLS